MKTRNLLLVIIIMLGLAISFGCTSIDNSKAVQSETKPTSSNSTQTPTPEASVKSEVSSSPVESATKVQFSENKKQELIGYVKKYTGSDEVSVAFIPSNNGANSGTMTVDFYLNNIPGATDLNNNIANIIIASKAMASESGISNVDVSVYAAYKTGKGLGLGSYYSSTDKTNIDVSDCHL